MARSFSDLILSDVFTFYVGTGETKHAIQVHSKAVVATCDYMKNLIEGNMKEAQERCAEQHVEVDDFVRFVEYAYRGDYTAPLWVLDTERRKADYEANGGAAVHTAEVKRPSAEPARYDWCQPPKNPKKRTWSEGVMQQVEPGRDKVIVFRREIFNERDYGLKGKPHEDILAGFRHQSNAGAEQNFTPVFLAYARLYSFAEMRLIHQLKALTLVKLHRTLRVFILYPQRIGDVIQLAKHTYENTPGRTADGAVDGLRKLFMEYIACEHVKIGKNKEFKALLEGGGEFVSDCWDVMHKYIL